MRQLELLGNNEPDLFRETANDQEGWQSVRDGRLFWSRHWLTLQDADRLYRRLDNTLQWQQKPISMYGRSVMQPRLQAWCGDATYRYSGLTMHPDPWTAELVEIRDKLNRLLKVQFNSVLANKYRDGCDYMGWHQDNEPELGENPLIASVNLGEERRFVLKHTTTNEKREFTLSHGSLLVMAGSLQSHWQHCVPKTRRPKDSRINLTFRTII
ncbi:alpha-ketoglutarate-dependent dioxygenase AlkB [Photobacterium makurazakiensis]|uniref:alpha-ketoglutarate-dependent dioxygenase AlkB family protein n=1 Tax=Photobacterium TaxID=657 RepID=UPI003D0A6D7D